MSSAKETLADAAALWSIDGLSHGDMVSVACDALVKGLDSDALRELAGVPFSQAAIEVPDLLEPALRSLNVPYFPPGSHEGQVAATKLFARRCLLDELTPRQFVAWVHATFRHGENDDLEPFLRLDDEYDVLEYSGGIEQEIDFKVRSAARNLVGY